MEATITTKAHYLFAQSEVSLVVCPATVFVKINADEHEEEVLQINRTSAKGDTVTHLWQTLYNEARNYNKASQHEARAPLRSARYVRSLERYGSYCCSHLRRDRT